MAAGDRDSWLDDLSLVLTRDELARRRNDLHFETFHGSKAASALWLTVLAVVSGALGGLLVSGALWRSWLLVPLWPVAVAATWVLARRSTMRRSGRFLAFVAGHSLFWGVLIGIATMWGAQRGSAGWAYGIAGGLGFLVGVVHGGYEPDDLDRPEAVSSIGYFSAPLGACLACYAHRNLLDEIDDLAAAATAGAIAALVFLAPWLVAFLANLKDTQGHTRLAALLLHRDETVKEAITLLDRAMRRRPDDPALLGYRALAHALAGDQARADDDWTRHDLLAPGSTAADIARGWVALRRDRTHEAVAAFGRAASAAHPSHWALVGLGSAQLRAGEHEAALRTLERVPEQTHDALSLTYLAQAHLSAGDPAMALATATDAIDEADSTHGRSWVVRADAHRALGDLDAAAADYNKALWAVDEEGTGERATAGLAAIERPIAEDEPDW